MITSSNLLQANVTVIAGIMILLGIANFSENPTAEAFDDPQEVAYVMIAPFVMSSIGALISGVKGDDENKTGKISKMKTFSVSAMILGFVYIVFFVGYKSITF